MKKRRKQRIISFLLTVCMMIAMTNGFPTVAFAATNLDVSAGNVDINASGDYIITGSTNTNTIKVEPNITGVNITLNNVSIDVSSIDGACAFDIGDGASVNVILADGTTNTFKSGASKAGVKVEAPVGQAEGSVTIDGTGTLIAVGGKGISSNGSGAGIGGNGRTVASEAENTIPASGNITINSGAIQATGGLGNMYAGSGIGGGGGYDLLNNYTSNGGNTTIHGGNVSAVGGNSTRFSGAGIGGGAGYYSGNGGTLLIDGGNVTIQSGNGQFTSSAMGCGYGNARVRFGMASIAIKGSAVVNASVQAASVKYPTIYSNNILIGGNAVLKASNDTGKCSSNYGSVILSGNLLTITDNPKITALASTKTFDGGTASAMYSSNISSIMPIISGTFTDPLSTTTNTDIAISGGNSTNTKTITLPANYISFATNVDSIGRYTGNAGTNLLQDTGAAANIFNLEKKINQYNLKLVSRPVDQEAPIGLAGTAPTTDANNDGKITGTTTEMEYKLAALDDSEYKACSNRETTGLAAGDYLVRYSAKTGFNAGATTAVTVSQYVEKLPPVITSVTGNPSDWISSSVTLTANATDAESGLALQAYSFDGGVTWQSANTKTYDTNTNGIVIKVKDNAGNVATYDPINITKIDKTAPRTAVIANAANYTDSKWFNETQTITASFTNTDGCDEKLQYKVDDSAWTDGEAVNVSAEGKHIVNFRVIDALGRTSEPQTVNVNIQDKTSPINAKITVADKEFTSFLNTITFGLFFKNTVGVTITADNSISGINKIEYQKVSYASDYNSEGTWTEGSTLSVNPDEKFIIYAKITDNAGSYVIINSDGVIVDATQPALEVTQDISNWGKDNVNVKVKVSDNLSGVKEVNYTTDEDVPQSGTVAITNREGNITLANEGQYKLTVTAKDNSLNEITKTEDIKIDKSMPIINSVTGNAVSWTSNSVTLTVNATDAESGLALQAYSFDGGTTWQSSNTKTYDTNTNGIVIKVKDNAGNIAAYDPINITKINKKPPDTAVITNASNYTDSKWFNKSQTITASFTNANGCDEKLQYKVDDSAWTCGEAVNVSAEGKHIVNFRGIDVLGRTSEAQTVNVNIDKTIPLITGASDSSSYFIGRVINITDKLSGIADATYKNGTDTETSFKDGALLEKAGKYTLTLKDKAGNSSTLSFEIKALPTFTNVVYTTDCKELIDSIRNEFNSHNDLPEGYKTDINNQIKVLEDRYSQLDNEVIEIKTETSAIKDKVEKLPNGIDGLLNLQKEIEDEYNRIVSNDSTLTKEQKKALVPEAEYLEQQLKIIVTLQNQINDIKTQVSNIDTKDDGLISQENKIIGILNNISKLTYEQQISLKPQSDLLNSLLNRISILKEQVNTVKGMINSLPSPDKITKQDANNINNISRLYNAFTNEQKELLGEELIKKLYNIVDVLKKLMFYDPNTDTTVTGVDGTFFSPDVYIMVTPIRAHDISSKNISMIEGKELLSLYDISLLKDGVKIQPDGKIKVKIKIPEELRSRIGLDIFHIADDGTVTPMNASVEGDYLVFTTTHFSNYAIVAKPIVKELPQTGSIVDFNSLIIVGILLSFIGIVLIRKKSRKS